MTDLATFANAWDKKPQEEAKDSKNKRKEEVKPPATLGEKAQWKLKALAKKDFGKDRDAWVRWIERHRR